MTDTEWERRKAWHRRARRMFDELNEEEQQMDDAQNYAPAPNDSGSSEGGDSILADFLASLIDPTLERKVHGAAVVAKADQRQVIATAVLAGLRASDAEGHEGSVDAALAKIACDRADALAAELTRRTESDIRSLPR